MTKQEKLRSLITYVEGLKRRLEGELPKKYINSPEYFKQMIELDIKKTSLDIEKLKMGV